MKRTLIAGLVFFAVLGAYLLEGRRMLRAEAGRLRSARLVPGDINAVTGLTVFNAGGVLELERRAGVWVMVRPVQTGADPEAVASLLQALDRQQKIGPMKSKGTEITQYGLAQPSLKVAIRLEGSAGTTLMAGDESPIASEIYARIDAAGEEAFKVFTISSALRDQLRRPPAEFRDRRLIRAPLGAASQLSITSSGRTMELSRTPLKNEWHIVRPARFPADPERVTDLMRELQAARALEFIDNAPIGETFGLDTPMLIASAGFPDDETLTSPTLTRHALLIGARRATGDTPGGHTYYAARMEEAGREGQVFTVPQTLIDRLRAQPGDLRRRQLFTLTGEEAARISLRYGSSFVKLYKDNDDLWKFEEEGAPEVDQAVAEGVVTRMLKLRVADYLSFQPMADQSGLGEPVLILTISNADQTRVEGLETGRPSVNKDQVYARGRGDEEIFTIASDQPGRFFLTHEEFEEKSIFRFDTGAAAAIEITDAERKIVYTREPESWLCRPGGGDEPFQVKTVDVERLLVAMNGLKWKRRLEPNLPDEAKQIEAHGLNKPLRVMRILDAAGAEITSLADGGDAENRVYIRAGAKDYYALEKAVYFPFFEALTKILKPR